MKVRAVFFHPSKWYQDVIVTNAPSIEKVEERLEEMDCEVFSVTEIVD